MGGMLCSINTLMFCALCSFYLRPPYVRLSSYLEEQLLYPFIIITSNTNTRAFFSPDHSQFQCGKKSSTTSDCRQTVNGHDVFYEVKVQPCTLPVSFNFSISVPVLGFEFSKTLYKDQKIPIAIGKYKWFSNY